MGTRLRQWRADHDVTLEELADLSGYSVAMLSRVERDQRQLSGLARIRLARALGVKVRDLFPPLEGDERPDAPDATPINA